MNSAIPAITEPLKPTQKKNVFGPIAIIGSLFFIFGFVTWLNSVLIPYLRIVCELNNFESYLVTFAFYIAYLVMAIPSSWILKATGFKKGMTIGLFLMALGALVFIPAALTRTYTFFLIGLFVQGTGLALLQTAANPYITVIGPRESAAKRISIMGVCNKFAGIMAPLILARWVKLGNADELKSKLLTMDGAQKSVELNMYGSQVISPYIVMAIGLAIFAIFIYWSGLPEIDTEHEDEATALANSNKTSVFQFPHLVLGVLTLFLYVGAEVIAGDTIISYGASQGIVMTTAKFFTSFTLTAMLVGYIIGIICIPKYFSQEKALRYCAITGLIFSLGVLFTHGYVSVLFIALLGLANSLMWPALWPMSLADLGRFTKIGSALLIMAAAGGGFVSLLYGRLADVFNPHQAYWILVPSYLFILYYATKGYKIRK